MERFIKFISFKKCLASIIVLFCVILLSLFYFTNEITGIIIGIAGVIQGFIFWIYGENINRKNEILKRIEDFYNSALAEYFFEIMKHDRIFKNAVQDNKIEYKKLFETFAINLNNRFEILCNSLTKEQVKERLLNINNYISCYESLEKELNNKEKMELIKNRNIGKIYKILKEKINSKNN